jgi:hypothetical protein
MDGALLLQPFARALLRFLVRHVEKIEPETQIYASLRPPRLKRAVSFYEEQAARMPNDGNGTRTSSSVANRRSRNAKEER